MGSIIAGSIALAIGCGDDEEAQAPDVPRPPPYVRITAIRSSSGSGFAVGSGAPAVVEAGCDPDQTVGLEVTFVADSDAGPTFTLRPPGAVCPPETLCGTLLVTVKASGGKEFSVFSAAQSTPMKLARFQPFEPGEYLFSVELRDSADQAITIPEAVSSDALTLQVTAPANCGPHDGGADAGDANDVDAGDAQAGDAGPEAPADAPPDVPDDTPDAGSDQTVTDGATDAEEDQG
jgi:hypothetical protein